MHARCMLSREHRKPFQATITSRAHITSISNLLEFIYTTEALTKSRREQNYENLQFTTAQAEIKAILK